MLMLLRRRAAICLCFIGEGSAQRTNDLGSEKHQEGGAPVSNVWRLGECWRSPFGRPLVIPIG